MAGSSSRGESLSSIAGSVSTPSTKKRLTIFRDELPPIIANSGLRKAVNDVIVKGLGEVTFMKSFAAALVQAMEKQSKFQSLVGCYSLLKWSCLLLSRSQFATVSRNALCRVAAAQAYLPHIIMQRSFRKRRACRKTFLHLFSQSPDIYNIYIEEIKNARIPYKDTPELLCLLLESSSAVPSMFEQSKPLFLDIYVKAVLNAQEKPTKGLSESFRPLFAHMSHEDLQSSTCRRWKKGCGIGYSMGRHLLYQVQSDPFNSVALVDILSSVLSALRDDSSEVRRRALSAVKAAAKANTLVIMTHLSLIGPALAECLKDHSTPIRLATERCALHSFQLTKGIRTKIHHRLGC